MDDLVSVSPKLSGRQEKTLWSMACTLIMQRDSVNSPVQWDEEKEQEKDIFMLLTIILLLVHHSESGLLHLIHP